MFHNKVDYGACMGSNTSQTYNHGAQEVELLVLPNDL